MTSTGATSPPPPPPSSPPPPPPPADLMGRATSFVALVRDAWAEATGALDRRATHVGLSTTGSTATRTASVWPVIGVAFLAIALIADRVHSSHAVPVRWLVVLLLLGAVVVAGQLREGGKLPVLAKAPALIASPVFLMILALLLAAQQVDFLSIGATQIAWFVALVCVVVPLVRDARRSSAATAQQPPPPPPAPPVAGQPLSVQSVATQSLTALRRSAPLFGALLALVAIVAGWLPGQYGPGWFWTVVLLAAVGVAIAAEIASLPAHRFALPPAVVTAGFYVLTALAAGVAVASARLEVTSVLWIAAAFVLVREAWRRLAAEGGPIQLRSRTGIALAGLAVALLSLFATAESASSGGYYIGGLSYDPYAYGSDEAGYYYNPTEYYQPGFYYQGTGRGQPYSIPVVAGLVAMAGAVRRRRISRRVRIAAVVVTLGAILWAGIETSAGYLSVWVFVIGVLVAGAATVLSFWPARLSASSPHSPAPSP